MWDNIKKIAKAYAQEFCSDAVYPSHLFKALLHREIGLINFIETQLGKDYYYLQEWADIQMQLSPRAAKPVKSPEYSQSSDIVIEEAQSYQIKFSSDDNNPICMLAALATPGIGFSAEQLKTLTLSAMEICEKINYHPNATSENAGVKNTTKDSQIKYCTNKNASINPDIEIIGFEREIATIFEILGRKTKPNILITGETGVGKTSLINGFIHQLVQGNAPSFLKNAVVYELDLIAISADASYKGEIEDRFKKLLDQIREIDNAIILIESIHKIFDKQNSMYGASNILKGALTKGNILLICSSSIDGYTKNIETDKEFAGMMEKLQIEEPNAHHCLRIIKGAIAPYEKYHTLKVDEQVIIDTIRLAKRYLNEKSLPNSALDLLDRTMSLIRTMNDMSEKQIASLTERFQELKKQLTPDNTQLNEDLYWLNYEILNKISCILLSQLDTEMDLSKTATVQERINTIQEVLNKLVRLSEQKRDTVQSGDLYAVIAKQTGIPIGKVQTKERDRLINANQILKNRVVGQDHAIKTVLDAVYESRSGLNKKGQPMGSFFFLGPTGTGKTELSKALAAFLFEDQASLIRFDMSEFKEEHSVALLYGAPPGYVGYEEGGLLVNKIRQKPYSVILFDEIEKAHKSVFDLFLQILDEGKLHDRLGRVGDFSNALIIFTSNIGSQFVADSFTKGDIPKNKDLLAIMQSHFRPEFLGRITEIVPFAPISQDTVGMIFNIHLQGLLKLLEEQNITLKITKEVKQQIAQKGYTPQYGARPIIGIIRKELRRPLSKMIITGEVSAGDTVEVKITNGNTEFIKSKNLI